MGKLLDHECKLVAGGCRFVAGADEVGRGSFAGPVAAGCVVFSAERIGKIISRGRGKNREFSLDGKEYCYVNDSKRLSEKQRIIASEWVRKNSDSWAVGKAGVGVINQSGITPATNLSYQSAVMSAKKNLRLNYGIQSGDCRMNINGSESMIDHLLVDGLFSPQISGFNANTNLTIVVGGDRKSFLIACASIVAKVYRDSLMSQLGSLMRFSRYDWGLNKGYGTLRHREAIRKYGVCEHHRLQFVRNYI